MGCGATKSFEHPKVEPKAEPVQLAAGRACRGFHNKKTSRTKLCFLKRLNLNQWFENTVVIRIWREHLNKKNVATISSKSEYIFPHKPGVLHGQARCLACLTRCGMGMAICCRVGYRSNLYVNISNLDISEIPARDIHVFGDECTGLKTWWKHEQTHSLA